MNNNNQSPKSQQSPANSIPEKPFKSSNGYAMYVLVVLFIVYVINFIDRQIMSVFIGPIQQEFGLSDTSVGLLVGFAFALLYTFAGIPIARWADRSSRRNIIVMGLAVWSGMTMLTGLAKNFTHLFLARIGVGLGEAAGTPPAHSLIADYFPLKRRATALAFYSSGVFVGAAFAYLGGGYLREFFDWRTAFIAIGLPGLLFALVVRFTVKEPPRGFSEGYQPEVHQKESLQQENTAKTSLADTFTFLMGSKSWLYLLLGASFLSITGYGVLMWGYEYYGRMHHMQPIEIGKWMAFIVGVGGSVGTLLGGRLADKLNEIRPSLSMSVPALITLLGMPLGVVFLMTDSALVSLCCFFPFYLMLDVYIPMMYSTNQSLARLEMRATASAILLFVINIVGAGAGPFLVGALSDYFSASYGVAGIRYALLSVVLAGVVGSLFLLLSSRYLQADLKRTRA